MDIKEQLKDIKTQLRLSMNGVVSQSMREKGLNYKLNFGVELPRIKSIAAAYEKNHELAQTLWKEDIRECKILAGLLQPVETFFPEIADIWVENMPNIEIAELTCMNLFQHLPYAPAKSFHWIASEEEYAQICGFLTIARLLMKKGDMAERPAGEFLDQAVCAVLSGSYHVRNAAFHRAADSALVHALLAGDLAVGLAEDQISVHPAALDFRQGVKGVPQQIEHLLAIQELLGAGLVNTGGVFDPVITVQGIISPVVAHPLRMGGLGPLAGHERLGHFIGDFDILIG